MVLPPETRASLLLRMRDPSDEQAWREFQEIYQPLVYRLARKRGLQDADARELAQEVMIAVAGAIDRWEPDPARSTFRTWLYRVARNTLVNHLQRQNRREQATGDSRMQQMLAQIPASDNVSPHDLDHEFRRQTFLWAANKARSSFQPATWDAFWLTSVEGREVAEVAAQLQTTVGAVYVARSRVMARLRRLVEQVTRE